MLELTFRQTGAEMMVRIASTLLFDALSRSGCPSVPLSELSEKPQYGFTARASRDEVGPKFVRITDLADEGINWDAVPYCLCDQPERYVLSPGDILFARTGATTGKTHLISQAPYAVFASYLIRVRAEGQGFPEYLHSFFQSDAYWQQILEEKKGSAQPNVNGRKLMKVQVPAVDGETQLAISRFLETVRARQRGSGEKLPELPPPLSGQRRIVARIEELAALIREAQGLRAKAREEARALLRSTLQGVFGMGFGSPDAWPTLSAILAHIEGGWSPACLPYPVDQGEWGVLKVGAVSTGRFVPDENKALPPSLEPRPELEIRDGDFLFGRANTRELVGACAVVKNPPGRLMLCDKVFRFVFGPDAKIDKSYLDFALKSPPLREQIESVASGTSSSMKNISKAKVMRLRVPLPSLAEQCRIVAYLDDLQAQVDELTALQDATQAELDALLPSVLDRAFRGEL